MVVVSYSGKEINAKLVYYGPGLSGKTTNLEFIYDSVPNTHRGKMVSMKTRTERTLFFDFLPVDLGEMGGFKTRFLLYTVPGQVYYNATRKLVLRGVDAVVFVADSGRGKMNENIESLENLKENLREYGMELDQLPWVLQYNKRDLPDAYTMEEMNQALNPMNVPVFEAVATNGTGVFETFKGISKLLLEKLSKEVKTGPRLAQAAGSAAGSATEIKRPATGSPAAETPTRPARPEVQPSIASPEEPAVPKEAPARPSPPRQAPTISPPVGGTPAAVTKPAAEPVTRPAAPPKPESIAITPLAEEKLTLGKRLAGFFRKSRPEPVMETPMPAADSRPARRASDAPTAPVAAPAAPRPPAAMPQVEIAGTISRVPVVERRLRVPVPVRLSPEELQSGVTLKLILEVELTAENQDEMEKTGS